jgi:DNA-binding transcriptional MerR regulator
MSTIQIHKAFWGPIAELIERARLVSKGMSLSSEKMTDRLVRYYSANGVLDKPDRLGRDAAYNYRHLLQLLTARRLSEKGVTLEIIGRHNLSTTTEQLEAGLLSPIQTAAYAPIPKPDGLTVALSKSFSGSPVAMVDLLSEVQAIKDQLTKDGEVLRIMREEFGDLASNLKELRNGVAVISTELDSIAHFAKSGLSKMYEAEEKFSYMLDKQVGSYGEKFNYLTEGIERIERTLLKIETSASNGQEK